MRRFRVTYEAMVSGYTYHIKFSEIIEAKDLGDACLIAHVHAAEEKRRLKAVEELELRRT